MIGKPDDAHTEEMTIEVPVTWIICATDQDDSQKIDRRLHALADDLHEQKTKMKEGRYHWALRPDETIVLCYDTVSGYITEWHDIDEDEKWVVDWLRGAMTMARRKMT